ncbi:hypothetical protein SLEP1_g47916 [Rubroshorea leprosula]|uniref:Uncharacterized protein n=1 Tax=Rubroshorea leprosula TaxID=152421 RepID=A0AAV5LU15_9ROSI|nr:hypothetical protein SLEP1_g47916 [Rubroshorea leprosula]
MLTLNKYPESKHQMVIQTFRAEMLHLVHLINYLMIYCVEMVQLQMGRIFVD